MFSSRSSILLILLLAFSTLDTSAQNQSTGRYVDSLLKALPQIESDTGKLNIYSAIVNEYNDINIDSSMYYVRRMISHARDMGTEEAELFAYSYLGFVHYLSSQSDSAMYYYRKVLKGYTRLKDTLQMANIYQDMASVYTDANQLSQGLESYFRALSLYKAVGEENLATLYSDMGDLYASVDERDKANEYYEKALVANKKFGDKFDRAYIMLSLVGELIEDEKYEKAITYADSVVQIYRELENDFFVAVGENYLAECYYSKGNYNKAMKLFKAAGDYFSKTSDEQYVAYSKLSRGKTYLSAADSSNYKRDASLFESTTRLNYQKAVELLSFSRNFFERIDDQQTLVEIYGYLSEAYEALGQNEKALSVYKLRSALKDSLDIQNESKKVAQVDAQKALDLKDKELELQKLTLAKKRNERWFLIGGIALLLIIFGITYRSYRLRGISNKLLTDEKQKSEDLLHNILPEEIASELKDRGATTAQQFEQVTVLFTDFVNFTEAGERLGSQALVEELHTCFKAFDQISEKYRIEKIKTIGDAYLAVCGMPVADKEHGEKIVQAATEIIAFMKKRREQLGDKTFEIRIGIHSGDVVAGIVGVKKFAYDIWGDTVNTAARMEQNSEPGKINISQTTYELVQHKFTCTYRGELEAKNKGKLKMYFVES